MNLKKITQDIFWSNIVPLCIAYAFSYVLIVLVALGSFPNGGRTDTYKTPLEIIAIVVYFFATFMITKKSHIDMKWATLRAIIILLIIHYIFFI